MYAVRDSDMHIIPNWWFEEYSRKGIDMTSIIKDRPYRWDKDLIELLRLHGTELFARDYIWDTDWQNIAKRYDYSHEESAKLKDPRTLLQKIIHKWLQLTQQHNNVFLIRYFDRLIDHLL
jgi:hypothetical protein